MSAFRRHERLQRVESRSSSDSTERRLNGASLPSEGEGPLWNVELPFSAADRSTVDDPLQNFGGARS